MTWVITIFSLLFRGGFEPPKHPPRYAYDMSSVNHIYVLVPFLLVILCLMFPFELSHWTFCLFSVPVTNFRLVTMIWNIWKICILSIPVVNINSEAHFNIESKLQYFSFTDLVGPTSWILYWRFILLAYYSVLSYVKTTVRTRINLRVMDWHLYLSLSSPLQMPLRSWLITLARTFYQMIPTRSGLRNMRNL